MLRSMSHSAAEPGAITLAGGGPRGDRSALPNVLLIGDSISVGYPASIREALTG